MRHETKKLTLVINELLTHLLLNGAKDIDIKIHHDKSCSKVVFTQQPCHFSETFIKKLEHNLNTQRQNEVEGYYWQLIGEDDLCDELHLVGAMIDHATVSVENEVLRIEIIRNGCRVDTGK